MGEEEKYETRQSVVLKAMDQIKMMDTSEYGGNPMVEKMLVDQIEEQKGKLEKLECELTEKKQEISTLKVKIAVFNERSNSEKLFSWIRNLVGIVLGISGGLALSKDSSLNKIGLILVPVFVVIFFLTCFFSFVRGKHE